jgi:hypothetical protein
MKRHDEIDVAAGQNWSPLGLSRGLYWAIGQQSDMCSSAGIYSDKMKGEPYLFELRLLIVGCRRALRVVGHIARRIRV